MAEDEMQVPACVRGQAAGPERAAGEPRRGRERRERDRVQALDPGPHGRPLGTARQLVTQREELAGLATDEHARSPPRPGTRSARGARRARSPGPPAPAAPRGGADRRPRRSRGAASSRRGTSCRAPYAGRRAVGSRHGHRPALRHRHATVAGHARRDGRRRGRRRPVRRRPDGQPPPGAGRRAARQGGRALVPDRARWPTRSRSGRSPRPATTSIVSRGAHAVWHETGGSAANAGRAADRDRRRRATSPRPSSRRRSSRGATSSTRRRRSSRSRTPTTGPAAWSCRPRSRGRRAGRARARDRVLPRRRPAVERGRRHAGRAWPTLAAPFDVAMVVAVEGPGRAGRIRAWPARRD